MKKYCYCVLCKDRYEDDDSSLAVYFVSYSNYENREFGICYECIDDFKGVID
mgnify:CR=1 FL=1